MLKMNLKLKDCGGQLHRAHSWLCLSLFASFIALGCTASKEAPATLEGSDGPALTYFTSGDPLELIQGARLEGESLIHLRNIDLFNNFGNLTSYEFVQRAAVKPSLSPEESQKPPVFEAGKSILTHRFIQQNDSTYLYSNGSPELDMLFTLNGKRLEWVAAGGLPIRALHYSVAASGSAFSLLGVYEDPQYGKTLKAFIFLKPEGAMPLAQRASSKVTQIYHYLFGENVRVRWEGERVRTLHLCGTEAESWKSQVEKGMEQWQRALGSRLTLRLEVLRSYPPFSDLNKSCVYNVKRFLLDPREDRFFLGKTVFAGYLPTQELLDGDIFIFEDEFLKMAERHSKDRIDQLRQRTLLHEMGHWLGLHHVFDGTRSIMSYNSSHVKVEPHDQQAIEYLYKKD